MRAKAIADEATAQHRQAEETRRRATLAKSKRHEDTLAAEERQWAALAAEKHEAAARAAEALALVKEPSLRGSVGSGDRQPTSSQGGRTDCGVQGPHTRPSP